MRAGDLRQRPRTALLDSLTDLVATAPGAYAVVLVVVLTDAFFPVVPGETLVITAALFAERGDLSGRSR